MRDHSAVPMTSRFTSFVCALLFASVAVAQVTLQTVTPTRFLAGSPTTMVTMSGSGLLTSSFSATNRVEWVGAGGVVTVLGSTLSLYTVSPTLQWVSMQVPANLLATPGVYGIRWIATFPTTITSPLFPVTVTAAASIPPEVGGTAPAQLGMPGAAGVPVTVYGSGFTPTSQVFADRTPLATTFQSASALSAVLTSACSGATRTGALAISVVDGANPPTTSNAIPLTIYAAGSNAGQLTISPPGAPAGTPVTFTIGGIGVNTYPLLVVSPVPTAAIYPWPTYIENYVLGISLASTTIVLDGISQGIVSGPMPTTGAAGGGIAIPAYLPNPPIGQTLSFQAAWLDPSSSLGYRLTHALHGVSF